MDKVSKYNSTKDLKITYYLGAGASYNSVPIWSNQGLSMFETRKRILDRIGIHGDIELRGNQFLKELADGIGRFGKLADEYGTIDVYAKRLLLTGQNQELLDLKFCLSIYLELWERFISTEYNKDLLSNSETRTGSFDSIDKRYLSMLSILLQETHDNPRIDDKIKFLTWNYDLQLETAYRMFISDRNVDMFVVNNSFGFLENELAKSRRVVYHLNGHRGFFKYEGDNHLLIRNDYEDFKAALKGLASMDVQFPKVNGKYPSCGSFINYAWEMGEHQLNELKGIMAATNVLVIIGYSFPSFNRFIDSTLLEEFVSDNSMIKKIIYQDPYPQKDFIKSILGDEKNVDYRSDFKQFPIPHEYLFPKEPEKPAWGSSKSI